MILATSPRPSSQSTTTITQPQLPIAAPLSPMAHTKSIGSIPLVPTSGQSSPTSILVDVTANCPNGVSELKRIQGYRDQLLLPEAMLYGNDLIKVWNIEDEQEAQASKSFDDTTHQTMIWLQEESACNKMAFPSLDYFPKDRIPGNEVPTMFPVEEIDVLAEEEMNKDMDDLFITLPPSTISLTPRPSLSPLSSPVSPIFGQESFDISSSRSSGSTNTVVLDNNDDNNKELLKPSKPPKGHRRAHRRNQSHFDFQFA